MHVDAVETARMSIYLNAALAGFPIDGLWDDGTRFLFARAGDVVADDPRRWLATHKQCRGFKTRMRRRKMASQLPVWYQTSHWALKVLMPDGEYAWRPSYELRTESGFARRVCLVTYRPEVRGEDVALRKRDLTKLAGDLRSVLKQLIALTGSRIPAWQSTFIGLLANLDGAESEQTTRVVPREVLGELPARVVNTAFVANVFTGMGNWGDNKYDPDIQPVVENLTASLFTLLAEGLEHAVDSTLPPSIQRPVT